MPYELRLCYFEAKPWAVVDFDKAKKEQHENAKNGHAVALMRPAKHGKHHDNAKKHAQPDEPDLHRYRELKKALNYAEKEREDVEQRMAGAKRWKEYKMWEREVKELGEKIEWYERKAEQELKKIAEED